MKKWRKLLDVKEFRNWISRIYTTTEGEPDCDTIQSLLPFSVEMSLSGKPLPAEFEAHLNQCPDCLEVYEGLRFVAAAEQTGQLTESDTATTPKPQQDMMLETDLSAD